MNAMVISPIDLIGSLFSERREGETLAEYRERIMQIAESVTYQEFSDENWASYREKELAGHVGMPVVLKRGRNDAELLKVAAESLLTYRNLSKVEGPFRWPERSAAGAAPLYSRVEQKAGGVGGGAQITLFKNNSSGKYYYSPGRVVTRSGDIYSLAGKVSIAPLHLLPNTTQTVVIPYKLTLGVTAIGAELAMHGHRIEVISENSLRLVGSDHIHIATVDELGLLKIENSTGGGTVHKHYAMPLSTYGACHIFAAPDNPTIGLEDSWNHQIIATQLNSFDGESIPIYSPQGIEVTTLDGAHTTWVDPDLYWTGNFIIGDVDGHTHNVVNFTVQETDNHSHNIAAPDIPEYRQLLPIITSVEGQLTDFGEFGSNPFIANISIEQGWTLISNANGLGDTLVCSWTNNELQEIPLPENPPDGLIIGIGHALPASKITVLNSKATRDNRYINISLRTEDANTGGVPHQAFEIAMSYRDVLYKIKDYSNEWGNYKITLPTPEILFGRARLNLVFTLLDADDDPIDNKTVQVELDYSQIPEEGYGVIYGISQSTYTPKNYKIAVVAPTNIRDNNHDNLVLAEYQRSRGHSNDEVFRFAFANDPSTIVPTHGVVFDGTFAYTNGGYEQWVARVLDEKIDAVIIPYGGQTHPFFRYYHALLTSAGVTVLGGTGQTGTNFTWDVNMEASDVIYLTSRPSGQDFGRGVELNWTPPYSTAFGTPVASMSQALGSYTGALIKVADSVTIGDLYAARLYLRSLATPHASGLYDPYVGYGTFVYEDSMVFS